MRSIWCVLFVLASGCYLSHRRPIEPDRRDAGVSTAPDAQVIGVDAGVDRCRLVPLGEVQVRDASSHSTQAPDLVWNGDGVSVAMMEGGGDFGHPIVTLAHVAADLSSVSSYFTAGEEAHGWGELASAGGALSVCWSGDPGSPTIKTMYRQIFEGDRLGARVDHDVDGEACLDLAATEDRVLMAWRRRSTDSRIATVVQALALDGTPAGEPLVLAEDEYPGRSVALAADDGAFFAALSPEDGSVRVVELGLDGAIRDEATLTISDARGVSLAVAHDRVAVVAAVGPSEVRSLSLVVLDRALAPRSFVRRLTDGAPSSLYATIAPLPDGWLVAWTDEHQPSTSMTLLHVDEDGAPREPRFVAHRGDNSGYGGPSIATSGDRAYVALSHEIDGAEPEQTFVQGWRCEPGERDPCAPQDVLPGACLASEPVGWYWIGDDCAPLICPSVCGGTDCDRLAPSRFACLADRTACEPPPACERLEVIDGGCIDSLVVPEHALNIVRVERTVECACATELRCNVRVDAPFELALEIDACPLAVACGCSPGVVSTDCHLPALSAGTWTIQPPGLASFAIEVRAPWEMTETVPFCTNWE